jgi:hypothetical protein
MLPVLAYVPPLGPFVSSQLQCDMWQGREVTATDSSPVGSMMKQNFHMLWQWHTDHMTAAASGKALRKVPTALQMLDTTRIGGGGLRNFGANSCVDM